MVSIAPNLIPIAPLIGSWTGPGRGEYPTIDSFDYTETIVIEDIGKPFLFYRQRTRSPDGRALHTESGFLRVPAQGIIEFTLAQPTGHTELCAGVLEVVDGVLELTMTGAVLGSASAKAVEATERRYRLDGDTLRTDFAMAAVGVPLTHHLTSDLRRD
ncbi:FABP family protein [Gordonia sp. CPCC 205515]|uniref:FABP family protein n=1 Tax=Gordonia sp. CPCC 205515 TaxID=3140791 RepID=UPI003AF3513C